MFSTRSPKWLSWGYDFPIFRFYFLRTFSSGLKHSIFSSFSSQSYSFLLVVNLSHPPFIIQEPHHLAWFELHLHFLHISYPIVKVHDGYIGMPRCNLHLFFSFQFGSPSCDSQGFSQLCSFSRLFFFSLFSFLASFCSFLFLLLSFVFYPSFIIFLVPGSGGWSALCSMHFVTA